MTEKNPSIEKILGHRKFNKDILINKHPRVSRRTLRYNSLKELRLFKDRDLAQEDWYGPNSRKISEQEINDVLDEAGKSQTESILRVQVKKYGY